MTDVYKYCKKYKRHRLVRACDSSVLGRIATVMEVIVWLLGVCLAAAEFSPDIESFLDQRNSGVKRRYRPLYHLSAPVGWLREPAAFIYYNALYHVFYQYHPYNGAWGPIHWGHAVSENLVDWTHYPAALIPRDYYEKHGCLAGTALVHNGYLTLFYTGEVMRNNRSHQTQNVAISADAIIFQKYLYNPVIKDEPDGAAAFRNPKVWRFRDTWYMMVGTATKQHNGKLVIFTSMDMFTWNLNRTIAESVGDMGYMWENPDIIRIDDLDVLILSAQGIHSDGFRFRNIYQTGYVVGKFNYEKCEFEDFEISTNTFNELDHGHDFYSAKTAIAPDGRRLLIAWLGMWEESAMEVRDGWASMLTLVRELRLNPLGSVLMYPVKEVLKLRTDVLEQAWYAPGEAFRAGCKYFELLVNATMVTKDVTIIFEWGEGYQFKVGYSAEYQHMIIDRGGLDGVRRADWRPEKSVYWRMFIDSSAAEIFCGAGEVVFSSRIYPRGPMIVRVAGQSKVYLTQYKIRRSVGYINKKLRKKLKKMYAKNRG